MVRAVRVKKKKQEEKNKNLFLYSHRAVFVKSLHFTTKRSAKSKIPLSFFALSRIKRIFAEHNIHPLTLHVSSPHGTGNGEALERNKHFIRFFFNIRITLSDVNIYFNDAIIQQ